MNLDEFRAHIEAQRKAEMQKRSAQMRDVAKTLENKGDSRTPQKPL